MISNVDCVRIAMPQGSHESERDPALKRKAWLAVFALSDADTKQTDRGKKTAEQPKPAIPDSWSLTEQQKAFIDLFSGDDDEDNDKKS